MYWIDLRHHPPYSRPKDLLLGWLGDGSRHYVDKDDREPPSHIWVSDIPTTPPLSNIVICRPTVPSHMRPPRYRPSGSYMYEASPSRGSQGVRVRRQRKQQATSATTDEARPSNAPTSDRTGYHYLGRIQDQAKETISSHT
ncbi:hypothetical protein ACLOJK_005050 [Asimina triloba]